MKTQELFGLIASGGEYGANGALAEIFRKRKAVILFVEAMIAKANCTSFIEEYDAELRELHKYALGEKHDGALLGNLRDFLREELHEPDDHHPDVCNIVPIAIALDVVDTFNEAREDELGVCA